MMLQYPDRPKNEREKLQARLEWLINNQPNNLEAIAAVERRLGVHMTRFELEREKLKTVRASQPRVTAEQAKAQARRHRAARNYRALPFAKGYIARQKAAVTIHY